jgi:CheY-like chemotaxis protein
MNKKRVLIADDDELILLMVQCCIEHLNPNCQVVTVKDGMAALDELLRQSFDLLVTNYNMPGLNGLALARGARQLAPTIQIIVMTSENRVNIQAQVPSLPLTGVIAKPFTMLELRKVLQEAGVRHYIEHNSDQFLQVLVIG